MATSGVWFSRQKRLFINKIVCDNIYFFKSSFIFSQWHFLLNNRCNIQQKSQSRSTIIRYLVAKMWKSIWLVLCSSASNCQTIYLMSLEIYGQTIEIISTLKVINIKHILKTLIFIEKKIQTFVFSKDSCWYMRGSPYCWQNWKYRLCE